MAYDGSYAESRRARDAEPIAEPDNDDAIREIVRWISQNLSPDETLQLYDEIGKLDATGPPDMSRNDRNEEGMQEAESQDEPPEFYGKPSPGGTYSTRATPRREPQQGAPARSGGLPADKDRTNRPVDDDGFRRSFPRRQRIGLRARGWPANPRKAAWLSRANQPQSSTKLFPDAKRLRV